MPGPPKDQASVSSLQGPLPSLQNPQSRQMGGRQSLQSLFSGLSLLRKEGAPRFPQEKPRASFWARLSCLEAFGGARGGCSASKYCPGTA